MIVRPKASLFDILFAVRGSIAGRVAWRCAFITVLACVVVYAGDFHMELLSHLGTAPFGLIGIAISVFMSFRNSAAYERWWEGRKQWGELLVQVRSLSRELSDLDDDAKKRIFVPLIAYAHALSARLRGEDEIVAVQLGAYLSLPAPTSATLFSDKLDANSLRSAKAAPFRIGAIPLPPSA